MRMQFLSKYVLFMYMHDYACLLVGLQVSATLMLCQSYEGTLTTIDKITKNYDELPKLWRDGLVQYIHYSEVRNILSGMTLVISCFIRFWLSTKVVSFQILMIR